MHEVMVRAVFILVMLIGAIWDVRTRRIPNWLTLGGMAFGLALAPLSGWSGLLSGVEGVGLALVVSAPLLLLGGVGGGDAKLLMAAGAFLGPARLLTALIPVALVGGVLAVGTALWTGQLLAVLRSTGGTLAGLATLRRGAGAETGERGGLTVPYGVAIALGCIWGWFL